jgi:outer membrane protein assembly factor BamB
MKAEKLRFVMVAYLIIQVAVFIFVVFSCKSRLEREELIKHYGRREIREEKCDGKDDNENGLLDEGCILWSYEFTHYPKLSSAKICSNKNIVLLSCNIRYNFPLTVYALKLNEGKVIWKYNINDGNIPTDFCLFWLPLFGQPLEVSDLNGDGKDEVIVIYRSETSDISEALNLLSLDCDGNYYWTYKEGEKLKGDRYIIPPSVEDIDKDGKREVVIGKIKIFWAYKPEETESKFYFYFLDREGTPSKIYSLSLKVYSTPFFKPLFGDIDGDGKNEMIFASIEELGWFWLMSKEDRLIKGKLYLIDFQKDACEIKYYDIELSNPFALGDINSDGKEEIIIPSGTNLYAIDEKGNLLWNFNIGYHISSQPVISDIDSDGKPEILFISRDGKIKVLNGEGKLISEYEVWKRDEIVEVGASSLALVDIDFDGKKEIIGWTDEVFMIRNGVKVWNFIVGGPKRDFEPPLVVNDDGDFKIVVTFANRIYTLKAGKVKK